MSVSFVRMQLDRSPIEIKSVEDLGEWIGSEREIWRSYSSKLIGALKPHFTEEVLMPISESLKTQIKFLDDLAHKIELARSAHPHNATEMESVIQLLSQLKESEPNRFLTQRVEDDAALHEILEFDELASGAGFLIRQGRRGIKFPNEVPDELRDAQFRFQLYLNEIRSKRNKLRIEDEITHIKRRHIVDQAMADFAGRWRERQDEAQLAAKRWLLVFGVTMGLVAMALMLAAHSIWIGISDQLPRVGFDAPNGGKIDWTQFEPSKFLLAVAPFAIVTAVPVIWLFRHMSRLFVENLADSRDAALRHTMAQTYVALNNSQAVTPTEQERALILGALFRPGVSQAPDEGAPIPLLELLRPHRN